MIAVLAALAGGVGAAARFLVDSVVRARLGSRYPVGTFLVNASGSLLLGFVAGLAAAAALPEEWRVVIGSGFLGGFTTFSAAAVEAVNLMRERRWTAAALHGIGMVVVCAALAAVGWVLATAL